MMPLKQKHSDKNGGFWPSRLTTFAGRRPFVCTDVSFGVIFFVDLGNRLYMDLGETEIIVE